MTCENSYNISEPGVLDAVFGPQVEQAIHSWKDPIVDFLNSYTIGEMPDDILNLLTYRRQLQQDLSTIRVCTIQPISYDVKTNVINYYSEIEASNQSQEERIRENTKLRKQQLIDETQAYNKEVITYNTTLTQTLEKKHKQLLKYKKPLEKIFTRYNITATSLSLSDDITEDEFNSILDASIAVCKKYSKLSNNKLKQQLKKLTTEDGIWGSMLIGIALLLFYLVLPVISVVGYYYQFKTVDNMANEIDQLKIARALMAEIDYKRFIDKDKFKELQGTPDFTELETEEQTLLEEITDITDERKQALMAASVYQEKVNSMIQVAADDLRTTLNNTIQTYEEAIKECQALIDEQMEDYKPFPTTYSTSATMSHAYVLGRYENTIDVTVDVSLQNLVFKYTDTDRQQAVDKCKLYLSNALLSVQPKRLTVEIYDPIYQGSDFAEFFAKETSEYIKVTDENYDKSLAEYRQFSIKNIQRLNHKTIDEFNRDAEERGIVTIPYKLFIIASGIEHNEDDNDKDLKKLEYLKNSVESGVLIWLIDTIDYDGLRTVTAQYEGSEGQPIQYDVALGAQARDTFIEGVEQYKTASIDYKPNFGDIYIPREKWWTWNTIQSIELNFGLEDGDPTKGHPINLGDDNVHAMMGGATGAGKSAAINQMLVSLITKYAPSELQITYVDFKNVEAAKFTRGVRDDGSLMSQDEATELIKQGKFFRRISYIPHFNIISGTTDGGYALSLFNFLMEEMQRRQKILNKYGLTKVEELRTKLLCDYNVTKGCNPNGKLKNCKYSWADMRADWDYYKPNIIDQELELPRYLIVLDEFQVMFNPEFVPARTIDEISGKITAITKLARAMGCHFWFTSQSMKGTMSKDTMANFSLRAALRCTKEVSEELLGNDASGKITEKFGYMYTNDSAGESKQANRFWRVPFLHEGLIPEYVNQLRDMLPQYNEVDRQADFYDDKQLMPSYLLDEWYTNYPDAFSDPNTLILGERAAYSSNKAPATLKLINDTSENILIAGFETEDVLNLALTIADNLQHKTNAKLIMNVADNNAYKLIQPEQFVEPAFQSLCSPEVDPLDIMSTLSDLVEKRQKQDSITNTIYVLLILWEKADGVFLNLNYRNEEIIKSLLRSAPSVGIHFIFALHEKLDTPRFVPQNCAHRLAGLLTKDAYFFINTPEIEKLPSRASNAGIFAIYEYGSDTTKIKIYQHEFSGETESRAVVL